MQEEAGNLNNVQEVLENNVTESPPGFKNLIHRVSLM